MPNFTGKIKSGKIIPFETAKYFKELEKAEGKDIAFEFKVINSDRSQDQNRYYWGIVVYLLRDKLEELGYVSGDLVGDGDIGPLSSEEVHEFLKDKFARIDIFNSETSEVIGTRSMSTKDMTKREFHVYIERIRRWAAEMLHLDIPDPESQKPKPSRKLRYGTNKTAFPRTT